jgi:SAM-dependent methyltransferase
MYQRTQCPACESAGIARILDLPFEGDLLRDFSRGSRLKAELSSQKYSILRCNVCDLFFQELVADARESAVLYQDDYAGVKSTGPMPLPPLAHMAEEAMLIRLLFPERRPVVLDFGMGMGHWAGMVRAFDCEAWGTDINDTSAEAARGQSVVFSKFEALPENHFDFINADQVFEHLAEPLPVARTLNRLLKADGILKISTPGDLQIKSKIRRAMAAKYDGPQFLHDFDSLYPLAHLNLFSKTSLVAFGRKAGLAPFRVPLGLSYSTMTLFHTPRQWNRNLRHPFKRWSSKGTWQFFKKKPAK